MAEPLGWRTASDRFWGRAMDRFRLNVCDTIHPSMNSRKEVFNYERLPWYGRLSLMLGNRAILKNMVEGSWLDVLCGYAALLQRSQSSNRKFIGFYCLDHKLDDALVDSGFALTETYLDDELPYVDDSFDNITIINGLEHLWKAQDIVGEMHRVLAPGGALQIVVPSWTGKPVLEFVAFRLKQPQAFIEMNDHKMYYDKRSLWPLLIRAGFAPSEIKIRRFKLGFSLHAIAVKSKEVCGDYA
ncbi:MAG: class I SAM-dependent methyltransferase [Acidimicrobiia bacterium]